MSAALRQSRVGQNLVEFALIAPMFFFLIFGILEGGRMIWTYHTMSNATKEAARYATVRGSGSTQPDAPATAASLEDHMLDVSTGLNDAELDVTLVLIDGDMNDRSQFRVEATYEFEFIVTGLLGVDGIGIETSSTDMFWREPDD